MKKFSWTTTRMIFGCCLASCLVAGFWNHAGQNRSTRSARITQPAAHRVPNSTPIDSNQFADVKEVFLTSSGSSKVELCQFTFAHPPAYHPSAPQGSEPRWRGSVPMTGDDYAQGEYIGPARTPHVRDYRLRVDDQVDFVYRFTHEEIAEAYRLIVGDEIIVESFPQDEAYAIRRGDISQGRALAIQPDGSIVLPYIGRVLVVGHTIDEVERDLEARYSRLIHDPEITVTPWKTNTKLEDLRSTVDARFGSGGQSRSATVTPDGSVQLVGIGSVCAQGLTLAELQEEINVRYVELVGRGVEVTAILRQRAPRFVWVVGEVVQPGQFELKQPITVVQALALSQGFLNGGNVREIIVFRRDENWQLMATRLDVRGVFVGRTPFPSDNIWLRDNDIVVVPKGPIQRIDEFINLVFTRGIYGVVPFSGVSYSINSRSSI
jgi:polysaccharide export outer membrane protein